MSLPSSSDLLTPAAELFLSVLSREAGVRIMVHYHDGVEVASKADQSPLTAADLDSHQCLVAGLRERWPEWPVLSEEGASIPYAQRREWEVFWLVDPLDGTKEFIRRNGEFTVNIALIAAGQPVFGVVYVPALRTLYRGGPGRGAWRETAEGVATPIQCRRPAPGASLTVVGSRAHASPELAGFLATLKVEQFIAVGSSIKFCRVAEGAADLYPRFGPTMEWDTAAGHAVVLGAGGFVSDKAGQPMRYHKECLRNDAFLVSGGPWLDGAPPTSMRFWM